MTCVWRRRLASSSGVIGLLLLLGAMAVTAQAQPKAVRLVAPELSRAARERMTVWVAEDRRWLGTVPTSEWALSASVPDSSLDLQRRLVGAALSTDADSVVVLRTVANRLRDRWLQRGYLTASIVTGADTLFVQPGAQWTLGSWDLSGDEFTGREHLLDTWLPRSGDVFRTKAINLGIDRVLVGTGEAGFPFARWVTRGVDLDSLLSQVHIRAVLLSGQRSWLGPISSTLVEPRARRFLARSSGLTSGEMFRQTDVERAVDRLVARDLYASVGVPSVYMTSAGDTVGIHFPVVARRKVNRLQVVLGLSQQEEGGSRLSGEVDLRLPNMGGSGRKLQVGWRDDGVAKRRFGFSYLEPLAFGTALDMGLMLDNEVESDSYTRFRFDNKWSLPVVALWGVEMGVGWDRATYPEGTLESTSRTRANGALYHKRGDRTRSGWQGQFVIETAWRSSSLRQDGDLVDPLAETLGEAVTQRIFKVDVAGEWWAASTVSLFARSSFRQLTGGELNVPFSEQFRFGGSATLRGYREDEFNGSQAAWGAVEVRIGRPEGSRLYTFYDLGYFEFWNKGADALAPEALRQHQGWPRGYGLGILARTPGGDFSLAIGFPGTVDFDQAKLHVTLLETF